MLFGRTIWFAFNEASGSNSEDALKELEDAFAEAQCQLGRRICFPTDQAPDRALLEAESVDTLAIFAGDGTIHSIVTGLYGWDGAVLVLPGGTMNLLSHRLHGEVPAAEIIARVAEGKARRVRPSIIRSRYGDGLTGMLAGPGTAWNDVREAMRESDIVGLVSTAKDAITESAGGAMVACVEPASGRAEGYSAITLNPHDEGIELNGFYADSFADYLQQGLALLRRNFRLGPHDRLGTFPRLTLASTESEPMGLLIDGEPKEGVAERESFEIARCEVDLLTTTVAGDDESEAGAA